MLTAAGQHLLALARQVLPALAQTERQLVALHSGEAGRLHLALDCHSCIQWLLPLLPDFRRQWPGVIWRWSRCRVSMPSVPCLAASSTCCSPRMCRPAGIFISSRCSPSISPW